MLKNFVLVNSLAAFNFAKKKIKNPNIVWLTTSPYLDNYFKFNGIKYFNIEKYFSREEYNKISIALVSICKISVKKINSIKSKSSYIDYNYLLSAEYLHLLSSLFYKVYLTNKIKKKFKGKIIIIGSFDEPKKFKLNYMDYRFSNLFASISNLIFKDIEVIKFKFSKQKKILKINEVKNRKMSYSEKFLSITNNSLSSFFFKLSKKFFHSVKIPILNQKGEIGIYDTTDQIEDAFLRLLNDGWRIKFLNKINYKLSNIHSDELNLFKKKFNKEFIRIFTTKFPKFSDQNVNKSYLKCYQICLNTLIEQFLIIEKNKIKLDLYFDKEKKKNNRDFIFLSNYIFDLIPQLYVQFLKSNNTKIIFSEHGFCMGTIKSMKFRNFFHPMNIADIGIYYWKKSTSMTVKFIKKQKSFIGGFPKSIYDNKILTLKKLLIKKLIKIDNSKKSIIYVADIEKNNFQYGPYDENDYNYVKTTKSIINYLCKKYHRYNIVIKLYPTNRYLDNYEFNYLKDKYKNLIIIRFIDFRFLRFLFDKIYISSGLSALGWALGSNSEVIYLEKDNDSFLLKECIRKKKKLI